MKIVNPINVMKAAEEDNVLRDNWVFTLTTHTGTEVWIKVKTPKPISKKDALFAAYAIDSYRFLKG